jgi:hypothetical protein
VLLLWVSLAVTLRWCCKCWHFGYCLWCRSIYCEFRYFCYCC